MKHTKEGTTPRTALLDFLKEAFRRDKAGLLLFFFLLDKRGISLCFR